MTNADKIVLRTYITLVQEMYGNTLTTEEISRRIKEEFDDELDFTFVDIQTEILEAEQEQALWNAELEREHNMIEYYSENPKLELETWK